MARMRALKPGFFLNETLAEIQPLGRLLFEGLWCLADRQGRLEDRPRKIKAEVLPYDDVDVDALLNELQERGFILRYTAEQARYIQVLTFTKHQTPHIHEQASTIPAPDMHGACTVQAPDGHDTSTVPAPSLTLTLTSTLTSDSNSPKVSPSGVVSPKRESAKTATAGAARTHTPKADAPKPERKPRAPDPLWDALANHFPAPQTDSERGKWNAALKQLRAIGVTPDDIHTHIAEHSKTQAFWQLSPLSLVGHWSELAPKKAASSNGTHKQPVAEESAEETAERFERAARIERAAEAAELEAAGSRGATVVPRSKVR